MATSAKPQLSACKLGFISVAALQCASLVLGSASLFEAVGTAKGGDAFTACPPSGGDGQDRVLASKCAALSQRIAADRSRFAADGLLFTSWPLDSFGRGVVRELDAYLSPEYYRRPLPRWGWLKGQPNRVSFGEYQLLAPSDHTVQGPHQENMPGDPARSRARVVVFICEEPAMSRGYTALFDMQRAWEKLPADVRAVLRGSSFEFPMMRGDWQQSPCVLENEFSGELALQFYGFGQIAHACVERYRQLTGSVGVELDPHTYGVHPTRGVLLVNDSDGERLPFEGELLQRTVAGIYQSMVVHRWAKGDVLVVDNLRWAHARLEGNGTGRKLNFVIYSQSEGREPMDAGGLHLRRDE